VNKENASKLWKMIQEAGDYLRGLEVQPNPHYPTLNYSTYADIKNLA
jgi:hypothetical protein